eukprot:gnl/Chilomastix_cuspidata/6127.p1 GENE.gnl/Chilomastix_cuspidata/6127~~gnl/Chilomastix_cuspidata/6127.p1  ORF type:complete len:565 (+),score=188.47 gnl/Chilomastix_cuspidata/6127:173-1696(+)
MKHVKKIQTGEIFLLKKSEARTLPENVHQGLKLAVKVLKIMEREKELVPKLTSVLNRRYAATPFRLNSFFSLGRRAGSSKHRRALLAASWNSTGMLLAVAAGAVEHGQTCDHAGEVLLFSPFRPGGAAGGEPVSGGMRVPPALALAPIASLPTEGCVTAVAFHPQVADELAFGTAQGVVTRARIDFSGGEPVISSDLTTVSSPLKHSAVTALQWFQVPGRRHWSLLSCGENGAALVWDSPNGFSAPISGTLVAPLAAGKFVVPNGLSAAMAFRSSAGTFLLGSEFGDLALCRCSDVAARALRSQTDIPNLVRMRVAGAHEGRVMSLDALPAGGTWGAEKALRSVFVRTFVSGGLGSAALVWRASLPRPVARLVPSQGASAVPSAKGLQMPPLCVASVVRAAPNLVLVGTNCRAVSVFDLTDAASRVGTTLLPVASAALPDVKRSSSAAKNPKPVSCIASNPVHSTMFAAIIGDSVLFASFPENIPQRSSFLSVARTLADLIALSEQL